MERWVDVPDFPGYQVSDTGLIYSDRSNRILRSTPNQKGLYQIGMRRDEGGKIWQRKVTVSHLVANVFLPDPPARFTTIIHLDGNPDHNFVENLAWRPEGFARSYKDQFANPYPHRIYKRIADIRSGEVSEDSWAVARRYGLLERAVVLSVMNDGLTVFPTNQRFECLDG